MSDDNPEVTEGAGEGVKGIDPSREGLKSNSILRIPMTVLIAEADETIVQVVSDFLTERGFNTLPAFDLEQARQTLERFRIDAILLDIQMPAGLGTVLRHELQNGSYPKQIPVIILSACVDPDQLRLAQESNLGPCFPTPPDLEFLYQNLLAVRDQLHVRSARNP